VGTGDVGEAGDVDVGGHAGLRCTWWHGIVPPGGAAGKAGVPGGRTGGRPTGARGRRPQGAGSNRRGIQQVRTLNFSRMDD
jgi:hypothetical protein